MLGNPNPQPLSFANWESVIIKVTMSPPTSVVGWTLVCNFRRQNDPSTLVLQLTNPTVLDSANGVFFFAALSADRGVGDYDYDVWRIDAGFEKRLAYGPCAIGTEQWK